MKKNIITFSNLKEESYFIYNGEKFFKTNVSNFGNAIKVKTKNKYFFEDLMEIQNIEGK